MYNPDFTNYKSIAYDPTAAASGAIYWSQPTKEEQLDSYIHHQARCLVEHRRMYHSMTTLHGFDPGEVYSMLVEVARDVTQLVRSEVSIEKTQLGDQLAHAFYTIKDLKLQVYQLQGQQQQQKAKQTPKTVPNTPGRLFRDL